MVSLEFAQLKYRLTETTARIEQLQRSLTGALSPIEKADIGLMIDFYRAELQNTNNEMELHNLICEHGKIEQLKDSIANPGRYVTKAPPPPRDLSSGHDSTPRISREEAIASMRVDSEAALQRAKNRESELRNAIAQWHQDDLERWKKVTGNAVLRLEEKKKRDADWRVLVNSIRSLQNDPGYQWRLEQGRKVLEGRPPSLESLANAYMTMGIASQTAQPQKNEGRKAPGPKRSRIGNKRMGVIFGAIQAQLKGFDYCRHLDERNLQTLTDWQSEGCPPSYEAAYKTVSWRKRIQDEKHRFQRRFRTTAAGDREKLIQDATRRTRR